MSEKAVALAIMKLNGVMRGIQRNIVNTEGSKKRFDTT